MRGLDPRIHQKKKSPIKKMDCRVKPAMTIVVHVQAHLALGRRQPN
jgi:hypothetical protein